MENDGKSFWQKARKIGKFIGPGFITGASDDDPSGIATYSQTGAQFGYGQLWVALFSYPFMTVIQEMCGRIGLVTGDGLAGVIKKNYGRKILFGAVTLLLLANIVNIGADLGAMASAGELVFGVPFSVWLFGMAIFTILLEINISYPVYAKFLKYFTLSLFAYVLVVFVVKQDWTAIAISTFIPDFSFSKEYIFNIVALLGTTISPYLFFWQADEVVEEEMEAHKISGIGESIPIVSDSDVHTMRIDTIIGMFFSNLIMFFIIATTASTLGAHGIKTITTATDAAKALLPIAGHFAYLIFALGIIGTGLLAVPVLAGSASYAVSETFNMQAGLSKKFSQAKGFYIIIAVATALGLLVNLTPIQPFTMLYYTAILNGVIAPPLLILILFISNNKKILGDRVNSRTSNVLGVIITAVMSIAAIVLLMSVFRK